jgi:hypothetical protein
MRACSTIVVPAVLCAGASAPVQEEEEEEEEKKKVTAFLYSKTLESCVSRAAEN